MDSANPKAAPHQQGPEAPVDGDIAGASFFQVGTVAESILPGLSRPGTSVSTDKLQAAWVHLLVGYEWQWFVTCTFREAVHPERADKAFRYWVNLVDRSRLGPNYYKQGREERRARWVRALEWQKREVLHYHALVGNLGEYDTAQAVRMVWAEEWNRIGGFGRVDAIGRVGGVCGYVAKYVSKGGQIDLSATLRPPVASIWLT